MASSNVTLPWTVTACTADLSWLCLHGKNPGCCSPLILIHSVCNAVLAESRPRRTLSLQGRSLTKWAWQTAA